jgi:phosphatidylglycerophosphatase C
MTGPGAEQASDVVAVFDFDGTITRRDTLVPFLVRTAGLGRFARAFAAESWRLRRTGARRPDRDLLKERVLARLFAGADADELRREGEAYGATLPALFRPQLVEQLRWHRAHGHQVVLVSASLRFYLTSVARTLELDHLICVDLEVGDDGRCTGRLAGSNVRGPEKARRLREWLAGRQPEVWAYGDSSGDTELLAIATRSVAVTDKVHRLALEARHLV